MNIILGFGSTEQAFEEAEEAAICAHIGARYLALGLSYYTDEFTKEISDWLDARGKETQRQDKVYDKAEDYPPRYSSYYPTLIADASHMVAILKFHHIHRRHAMSPDGWALMQTKRLFDVVSYEIERVAA